MEKKSKSLFPFFIIILLFVTFLTYYRTIIQKNYSVIEGEEPREIEIKIE